MGGDGNGILIEASVLFPADETGNPSSSPSPSADTLLRRLRYSKIRTVMFFFQYMYMYLPSFFFMQKKKKKERLYRYISVACS